MSLPPHFIDEKTKEVVFHIKGGYPVTNALHDLYKDNEITDEGLDSGLESLPDYLAEKVRADL